MNRVRILACCAVAFVVSVGVSVAEEQDKPKEKKKARVEIKARPAIRLLAPTIAVRNARLNNSLILVRNPKVMEEIKLSEEQSTKIDELFQELTAARRGITAELRGVPAAKRQKKLAEIQKKISEKTNEINKAIEKTLDPDQVARLEQLAIQRQGLAALSNPQIAKKLKLTEEQLQKIAAIRTEGLKKRQQLIQDARAGIVDRGQLAEKTKKIEEQTKKEVLLVLTMEQQTRFNLMQGEAFDFGRTNARFFVAPAAGAIRLKVEAVPLERRKIEKPQKKKDE